jgi:alkane 1-monooxygenase
MGENILILAFVVIIIGGIGSIRGAFVAAVLVGLIDTMGRVFLPDLVRQFVSYSAGSSAGPALSSMLIIGRWLLAFTWDTGFAIEHVHGHHRNVGTELDPATAKRGEYIWAFVVRSTIGQWIAAKRIEDERLARKGIANNLINNRFWRGQLMTVAVLALYVTFLGPIGILFSAYAGAIGKIYLEVVNYIEHYGLVRVPGTRVEARHSWDSHRRVSTGLFYNLMLHSNHHAIATRRYWELEQSRETQALVLPRGYMAMIFFAFLGPPFFKFTDKLLARWDRELASPGEIAVLKERGIYLGDKVAA